MTQTALDVLPLERAKAELEIPAAETGQDGLIQGYIGAAVTGVEAHTGLPLVQVRERYSVSPDGPSDYVYLATHHIQRIFDMRWHEPGQEYAESPTGRLSNPDCRIDLHAGNARIWPPASTGKWPDTPSTGAVWLDVVRQVTAIPEAVVQACVVAVRLMYDGMEFRTAGPFLNLLSAVDDVPERGDRPIAILQDVIAYIPLTPDTPTNVLPENAVTLRGELVTLRDA